MLGGPSWPVLALRRSARRRGGACVVAAAVVVFALTLAVAGADSATASAAPTALPNARVYEQVSAQKKNGNEAGVILVQGLGSKVTTQAAYAAPQGYAPMPGATRGEAMERVPGLRHQLRLDPVAAGELDRRAASP